MTTLPKITKYRAVLGAEGDQDFAIVVVQDTGSVSWSLVGEQEYNDANCDDLPEEMFDQVNTAYEHLKLLGNDVPRDDKVVPGTRKT